MKPLDIIIIFCGTMKINYMSLIIWYCIHRLHKCNSSELCLFHGKVSVEILMDWTVYSKKKDGNVIALKINFFFLGGTHLSEHDSGNILIKSIRY